MDAVGAIKSEVIKASGNVLQPDFSTIVSNGKGDNNKDISLNTPGNSSGIESDVNAQSKLESIAKAMDNYVRSTQRDLKISVHTGTGNIMVKVISESDGRVIREIPPKELLDLAAKMEDMAGALFNETA